MLVDLTLPHGEDSPTAAAQRTSLAFVSLTIGRNLLLPKLRVAACGVFPMSAIVTMPKAPIDENHRSVFRQYQVRSTGQTGDMKTVPKPRCMQIFAHGHFWRGILAPHPTHQCRPPNGRRMTRITIGQH